MIYGNFKQYWVTQDKLFGTKCTKAEAMASHEITWNARQEEIDELKKQVEFYRAYIEDLQKPMEVVQLGDGSNLIC